jgi:hypothetical protein
MRAQDSNGSAFQLTGVAQGTQLVSQSSQSIGMANLVASASHAAASCFPYTVALTNANVSGSTFTGSFVISSHSGERLTMHVNAAIATDGLTLTSGTYTLAGAPPSCFPGSASGNFSGYQVPDVTGSWTGIIQPCDWNSQRRVCTNRGFGAEIDATLTQDDAAATVSGTYKVLGFPTFSSGTVNVLAGEIFSGQTLQARWTDNNGASFAMDGRLGQDASLKGVVIDAGANYYNFQMLHQ